ncbi:MAG: ABC transporter permease subunit, partial [Peptostreptococcaceae bacterium]
MNIFKFEFKRLLKSCIIWSLICGSLVVLFMALFPSMKDMGMQSLVNDKMDALPKEILKAFNIDESMDFSNIYNYLGYCIQYIAMASGIYGAILGVNCLIKEESQGTIEFLYSKPVTRTRIITSKLGAILASYFLYIVIVFIFTLAVCIAVRPSEIEVVDMIINIKDIFIG